MRTSRLVRFLLGLWLLGVAQCVVRRARSEPRPHPATANVGVDEHRGRRIPLALSFFRPDSGRRVRLEEYFAKRPVVLVLAYSECPMLCNLVLDGLAKAVHEMRNAPGRDFSLLTISIDPEETKKAAVAKHHRLLTLIDRERDPHAWDYLTGERATIHRLAAALGFRYNKDPRSGQYAHPAVVFVLAPDGTIASYHYGLRQDPRDLDTALERARDGRIETASAASSLADAVLQCFRFDPARSKYGWVVTSLLRGGALALVGIPLFALLWIRRRRRRTGARDNGRASDTLAERQP